MPELINTRCTQGRLIITETHIIVQLGKRNSETMLRTTLTDLQMQTAVPSIFGLGGGVNIAFHGQSGHPLRANLVKPADADRIQSLLTGRE